MNAYREPAKKSTKPKLKHKQDWISALWCWLGVHEWMPEDRERIEVVNGCLTIRHLVTGSQCIRCGVRS